jgi:hypothetical protein
MRLHLLALAPMFLAAPVLAQTRATAAEVLFREAIEALDHGNVKVACAKFDESQRLDPAIGTLMNLAACHEREGKTATAWTEYAQAASQAASSGQKEREKLARTRVAALEKQLRRVVVTAPARPVRGMAVKLDGDPFTTFGTAVPLDPGEHVLEATAPAKKAWKTTVRVAPSAGTDSVAVPELADAAPEPVVAPAPVPARAPARPDAATLAPSVTTGAASPADKDHGTGSRRTIGYVVGGAGIVSLALAGYYWSVTATKDSHRKDALAASPGNPEAQAAAVTLRDQALRAQTYAVVATGVGVVGVGAGLLLILTSPRAPSTGLSVTPLFGAGTTGAAMSGAF